MNQTLKAELQKNIGMREDLDKVVLNARKEAERLEFVKASDSLRDVLRWANELIASYGAIEKSSDA